MRNPTCTGLSPDPLGPHSDALGEFFSGEQPIHGRSPDGEGQRTVVGELGRRPAGAADGHFEAGLRTRLVQLPGSVGRCTSFRRVHRGSLGSCDKS